MKMESYAEFKKRANYGYQPYYTYYESTPNSITAGNVPGFQNRAPRNIGGNGQSTAMVQGTNIPARQQQNWNVTRNANGQVTSFSNQAGLQRQQRMQQMQQNNQYGNITPEQYAWMQQQRQQQMMQQAYMQRMRQMQQGYGYGYGYGVQPQTGYGYNAGQPAYQERQHGSVTSRTGVDSQGRRTFSAHN